ncbi:hypothetical protein IAI10_08680 [Clostridium sp. 19966]|uniref:hypothetical protein n=1 Tax=Clostridium sp. 19966 TaxID=2768166 RepID=UPI0028DED286|nr:hypothetical protein [Clostridium sp. 19966]MDT8716731.1 hypothetical protein [Clostridium sp. 19966]
MLILFLLAVIAAAGEYIFFTQRMETQKRTVMLLTKQNETLRSKSNKQANYFSTVNIAYSLPRYPNGYTTENCYIYLSPLENAPIVFQCVKPVRVSITDCAEILNTTWYLVSLQINNSYIKGWMKDSNIKFVVDEAASSSQ